MQQLYTPFAHAWQACRLRTLMILALVAFATGAWAAESYGFRINNWEVTSENYQRLSNSMCWHYDPAQNVLYLDEGTMGPPTNSVDAMILVESDINPTLTINVTGNCVVKGCLNFWGDGTHTICGDGTLTLAPQTIDEKVVTTSGTTNLTIKDVTMNIKAFGDHAMGFVNAGFSAITLDHCEMNVHGGWAAWFGSGQFNSVSPVLKNCFRYKGFFNTFSQGDCTDVVVKRYTINSVSAFVTEPVVGQPFPTTCTLQGQGFTLSGDVEWEEGVIGVVFGTPTSDVFLPDYDYRVVIRLKAQDDNYFYNSEDMTILINGHPASVSYNNHEKMTVYYEFPRMFDLWVGGTRVTSVNYQDVLGDGTVSYNIVTKTLWLTNATLSGQGSYTTADTGYGTGIYSKIEGLTIQLQGDNTVTGKTNCHGVYLGSETTIKGEGSMEATGYFGIYLHDKSLTINNGAKVKAIGQGGGGLIGFKNYSTGEYNSTLCIQHRASVTATDPFGSIINWKNLQLLDKRAINSPSNAVWSDHAVRDADSGDYITSTVTIDAAKYKLWIANQQVTANNQNDILGDGLISYNENTNTLHLAGTHQYSGGNHFINNEIPGLTIEAEGNPAYIIARTSAIKSKADLTITGNVLSVSSSEDCGVWLENNARLTIRNMPYFSVSESQWGICGSMSSSAHESLSIQSSKVYVKADVEAVCDFRGGINLSLCGIEVPVGGKVVNGRIVDQNGGTVKEVMISKEATPTDIDALQPDTESQTTDSNDGWYTLDGRKLNGMPAEKGVYVRNGRKVLK